MKFSLKQFLNERKETLGVVSEVDNLNDTVPSKEQIDKVSKDIDKELEDVSTDEPKEPKEDFITSEEAAKRIRAKVKAQIEADYRVTLVTPSTAPTVNEGVYAESLVVGKYQTPGGIFESSKPSVFDVSAQWEEDEQMTELNADVVLKLKIDNNEYSLPLKQVSFSIKL